MNRENLSIQLIEVSKKQQKAFDIEILYGFINFLEKADGLIKEDEDRTLKEFFKIFIDDFCNYETADDLVNFNKNFSVAMNTIIYALSFDFEMDWSTLVNEIGKLEILTMTTMDNILYNINVFDDYLKNTITTKEILQDVYNKTRGYALANYNLIVGDGPNV